MSAHRTHKTHTHARTHSSRVSLKEFHQKKSPLHLVSINRGGSVIHERLNKTDTMKIKALNLCEKVSVTLACLNFCSCPLKLFQDRSERLGEPKTPSALTCHPVFLMHGYIKPRCFHNADKDSILYFPHAHLQFCWGILWRYFCIVCPQSGSILHICRRTHMVVYRICWWEPQTPCPRRHTLPWERIVSSSIPTLCLHKTSRKSNVTAVKRCSCAHRWRRTNPRQHGVDRWTMWTGGHRREQRGYLLTGRDHWPHTLINQRHIFQNNLGFINFWRLNRFFWPTQSWGTKHIWATYS